VELFGSVTHTLFGDVPESVLDMSLRTVLGKQRPLEMTDTAVPDGRVVQIFQGLTDKDNVSKISVGNFKVNLAQISVCVKWCTVSCRDLRRWLRCSTKGSSMGHCK